MGIKVLHITESCRGGTAVYLSGLIAHQMAQSDRYTVQLLGCTHKLADELKKWPDILHHYRSSRKPTQFRQVVGSVQSVVDGVEPDIVHTHGAFAGFFARVSKSSQTETKYIHCAHGWPFQQDSGRFKTYAYVKTEQLLSYRTDAIVNISWDEARAARINNVRARTANVVITHGVRERTTGLVTPPSHDPDKLHICFVGRFDRQKGVDLLIDAWRELAPRRLVLHLIGDFDRDQRESYCMPEGIRLHGWIPSDEIDDYMSACDALIVPSRWEGFGLVVIEAMRNELAVLASARGALPELVLDGYNGFLFDPSQPGGLQKLLAALDEDPSVAEVLRTMGKRGRDIYEQRHTLPGPFKKIDRLYESLISPL